MNILVRPVAMTALALLPLAAGAQDFQVIGDPGGAPVFGDPGVPSFDEPLPPPAVAPPPMAPGPAQDYSLYRGSEASLRWGILATTPGDDGSFHTLALDTRHTLWMAPFLGTQFDLGIASLDWDETAVTAGVHVHLITEGLERFGFFYLPAWDSGFDERLDNYGVEGIFEAIPSLTIEARLGRFDGDGLKGPYFGANGFYALDPQIAVTAGFQHSRLDLGGADVNTTDALIGAEYYLPGSDIRLSGGVGLVRFGGDVPTDTDFKIEVGATIFAFGQPASTARMRSFTRQSVIGSF